MADRFGYWPKNSSVWGNWDNFLTYTATINPYFQESMISALGILVTFLEVVFAVALIIGFKTELFAKLSGILLLSFALAMITSTGIKGAFDYSVFSAAAAALALGTMKTKKFEIDTLLEKKMKM